VSILVIDKKTKDRIREIIKFSSLPTNYYMPQNGLPVGDGSGHTITINNYFVCAFTITMGSPSKLFRHLSVSLKEGDAYPAFAFVEEIAWLFEFTGEYKDWISMPYRHLELPPFMAVVFQEFIPDRVSNETV